jgi:RNA polymerase sigma-70 factor, ECF subfamily
VGGHTDSSVLGANFSTRQTRRPMTSVAGVNLRWTPMSSSAPSAEGEPTSPVAADLRRALNSHRRELTGYCYRMLGAGSEAEDAVQETMARAWASIEGFEGRSSLRTWLYRIANNICVDMLQSPQRRARPMELGPSTAAADVILGVPRPEHTWVQPIADERVIALDGDPAEVAAARGIDPPRLRRGVAASAGQAAFGT